MPRGEDVLGLAGRSVLVTGGAQGIGAAVAEAAAAAGAHVAITSRNARVAERAAARLARRHGVSALGTGCDVREADSVADLFGRLEAWEPGVPEGVVNNAGAPWDRSLWDRPLHRWRPEAMGEAFAEVARVDVGGARLVTRHALVPMRRRRRGALVYVASTPALTGYLGTPYTEAKAAVLGLMRDVARAYGPDGVRANAVALGNIRTAHYDELPPARRKALAREAPLGRWGEPGDAAAAILFLLSDLARFVTGQTLVVDGGTVMR